MKQMVIEKDSTVQIKACQNGWMVRPDPFQPENHVYLVFKSFSELMEWARCHFTYRSDKDQLTELRVVTRERDGSSKFETQEPIKVSSDGHWGGSRELCSCQECERARRIEQSALKFCQCDGCRESKDERKEVTHRAAAMSRVSAFWRPCIHQAMDQYAKEHNLRTSLICPCGDCQIERDHIGSRK